MSEPTATAAESVDELDRLRARLVAVGRQPTAQDVAAAIRAEGRPVSDALLVETLEALRRGSVGAGPLEPLIREPGVTDVLVNGAAQVYVDRGRGLETQLGALRLGRGGPPARAATRRVGRPPAR